MSDMKELMKTAYLGLCNPVKNKEALVLETLSEVFNHVDDVVVYCIRLLVVYHRDRLIRRNDWEVVTLRKHSYFMPRILPVEYFNNKYLYARRNATWIPTDYYGQTVLVSALSCYHIASEKSYSKKIKKQNESPFLICIANTVSLSFFIMLVTPFIMLFHSLFTLLEQSIL